MAPLSQVFPFKTKEPAPGTSGLPCTARILVKKPFWLIQWILWLSACVLLANCSGPKLFPELPGPGVYHTVQKGQTLYRIAQAYGIDFKTLQRINGIDNPERLQIGTRLWVPGASRVVYIPPSDSKKIQVARKPKRTTKKYRKKHAVKSRLMWPVKGTLTSGFGKRGGRNHEGIDIGARKGTPIWAADDGKVVFSGWGPTGYGKMIIVQHTRQLTTLYAHNSKNLVRKNTTVRRGQTIARVGATGRATGPHLHFEVRNNAHPKDPLLFLSN